MSRKFVALSLGAILAACTLAPAFELPAPVPEAARLGSAWERHLAAMRATATGPLTSGNAVRILVDGPATFGAMFQAIERAQRYVALESYIFEDDELGAKMAALLIRKRAAGVQVSLVYDGVGTLTTPDVFFDRMRASQVAVCEFNPVNPLKGMALKGKGANVNHRDHRKILIVDGAVAFTGGINVSSVYSSGSGSVRRRSSEPDPAKDRGWRDTQIEIRGPAVIEFENLYRATWEQQACDPAALQLKSAPQPQGDTLVRVIGSTPTMPVNPLYIEMLSALRAAERTAFITMAYFVPDRQTIDLLRAAATRGVDVRLLLPGFSDSSLVLHAGRSHYQSLLDAGVRIFERNDASLHAKTMVIDGVWSMVGSANMDWRSFLHNDEVGAFVLDASVARTMTTVFENDLKRAHAVTLETWADRGIVPRLREVWGRVWEYWL
jgi:cardiolipin synthase A/B